MPDYYEEAGAAIWQYEVISLQRVPLLAWPAVAPKQQPSLIPGRGKKKHKFWQRP